MKITSRLLRSRARCALHSAEYVDLSNLEIERVEKLHICPKLKVLNLRENNIDYVSKNLESCGQLWKLDLSNNKIQNLEGLSRFMALGSLNLANNDITWVELDKIRHLHALDLSLHGNTQLDKDPYYRIHIIDCLPNVWSLDGRIITSAERLQVQQFFHDSALSDHPVRHKLSQEKFTPTSRKNIEVTGVYGCRTEHLMRRFPTNGALNVDVDRRRIMYLAYNIEEDMVIESQLSKRKYGAVLEHREFLEYLIQARHTERIQCNMLLLLLVASLEFAIPTHLMLEVLKCTKLNVIGGVNTMDMFLLPRDTRVVIVCLLLSAVKVDKDVGEDGGLYDKLYLCLYNAVSELILLSHRKDTSSVHRKAYVVRSKDTKSLLASEVVQLMCIVPTYFEYITKDAGVMNLTTVATADVQIIIKVSRLLKKMDKEAWERKRMYEAVAEVILRAIQENAMNVINRSNAAATSKTFSTDSYVLNTSKALPRRPASSPLYAANFHATGRSCPDNRPTRIKSSKYDSRDTTPVAKLGEFVLLGPQNLARVISVPESDIILVQMDEVPADSGAMINNKSRPEEHFAYLDMHSLYWDYLGNYWRPLGTVGDRITIQTEQDGENTTKQQQPMQDGELIKTPRSLPPTVLSSQQQQQSVQQQQEIEQTEINNQEKANVESRPPMAVSHLLKEELQLQLEMDAERRSTPDLDESVEHPAITAPTHASPQPVPRPRSAKVRRTGVHQQNEIFQTEVRESRTADVEDFDLEEGEEDEILFQAEQIQAYNEYNSREESIVHSNQSSRPVSSMSDAARVSEHPMIEIPLAALEEDSESARAPTEGASSYDNTQSNRDTMVSEEFPIKTDVIIRRKVAPSIHEQNNNNHGQVQHPLSSQQQQQQQQHHHSPLQQHTRQATNSERSEEDLGAIPGKGHLVITNALNTSAATSNSSERNSTPGPSKSQGKKPVRLNLNPTCSSSVARPLTKSLDTHRVILSDDRGMYSYRANYSTPRQDSYRPARTNKTGGSSSGRVDSPPPQRPCSPSTSTMYVRKAKQQAPQAPSPEPPVAPSTPVDKNAAPVTLLRGDQWLGGGRDLHWENMQTRPKSAHIPGWMEGLPIRPKSAAAIRALKRTKAPLIITPSSLAYDSARATLRGSHIDFSPEAQHQKNMEYISTNAYAPSAPAYAPIRRPLRRMEEGVMCEHCQLRLQREEDRWRRLVQEEGGDVESNPCPSLSDINCDHEVPMDTAEYITTIPLPTRDTPSPCASSIKLVTFDTGRLATEA